MANKMLIDATHPEETRVTVVRGNRVEEFDFEAANRKQLRGNIYLAKVTRVEPSLQAAFVEYGGNRHGFLAFSEIHPDYYQLPKEDREALEAQLAAEAAANQRERERREKEEAKREAEIQKAAAAKAAEASEEVVAELIEAETSALEAEHEAEALASMDAPFQDDSIEDIASEASSDDDDTDAKTADEGESSKETPAEEASEEAAPVEATTSEETTEEEASSEASEEQTEAEEETAEAASDAGEQDESEDEAQEEVTERPRRLRDNYKIQEVIKRRQLLLVQVVKEERGNKGAALTTYLSLAGRYSVLMPNTDRGGGISRKITKPTDRKRLKQVAGDLDVPNGMGVILRTAGASRTKAEIKRDFEYLLRLWENVRELTLDSAAPTLVYEEGSLIKRSIRDLYNKDIDQVLVAGEEGYREAKDFMRMLMPSHSKNVQPYRDATPIFTRFGVEAQLDAMFSPQVTLKSGGYIVINQTEALVAIDVNSGKATREQNIEDTAQATNLEAAEEIARQLRLRDLAGLVVIDFIDMEENRNNRAVERRLKECLKSDRARIQVGRISHFGLLEMSRQRIRTGVLESSSVVCPHCHGSGIVRSVESVALHILRSLEDQLLRGSSHNLNLRTPNEVAMYILNQKRHHLMDLERRFGLEISIFGDDSVTEQHFTLERGELATPSERTQPLPATVQPDTIFPIEEDEDVIEEVAEEQKQDDSDEDGNDRRRRRRRRRRRGTDKTEAEQKLDNAERSEEQSSDDEASAEDKSADAEESEAGEDDDDRRRKRRRGRRGGRRSRRRNASDENGENAEAEEGAETSEEAERSEEGTADSVEEIIAEAKSETAEEAAPAEEAVAPVEATTEAEETAEEPKKETRKPRRRRRKPAAEKEAPSEAKEETEAPAVQTEASEDVAVKEAPAAVEAPAEPIAEVVEVAIEPVAETAEAVTEQPKEEKPAEEPKTEAKEEAPVAEEAPAVEVEVEASAKPKAPTKPVVTSHKVVEGETVAVESDDDTPRRTGWWQRRSFF
ncbi:Rne/Rng family ribonuclease [Pseudovibrio brasiliensis]|uniref:Ribonuclease E n=1 Tax=Pseudovibrio brasiliensis TaxID=1898042 RepID=A0ABX8AGX8_9HYPH|nr:ribonuclease E/G [Pseudovibrio brasiliensis]QUS54173.1 Rne/Rng family ribonuclease [Pseudovibrio brasiliensis]